VVAFDVIETLMSLEPLRARLVDIGQPDAGLLEAWYTRTLRDGMALSAAGDYVGFAEVAEAALRGLTNYAVSDAQVAAVMAGWSELPAFPDAAPALAQLAEAGLRIACLTNGSAYRAGVAGGPGDLGRGGVPVEAGRGGVPVRGFGHGRAERPVGAGGRARLGLSRRQAGRAGDRVGEP
jgi:hypothetical protein